MFTIFNRIGFFSCFIRFISFEMFPKINVMQRAENYVKENETFIISFKVFKEFFSLKLSSCVKHLIVWSLHGNQTTQNINPSWLCSEKSSDCVINTIKTINGYSIYAGTEQFVSMCMCSDVRFEPFMTPLQKQSNKLFNDPGYRISFHFTLSSSLVLPDMNAFPLIEHINKRFDMSLELTIKITLCTVMGLWSFHNLSITRQDFHLYDVRTKETSTWEEKEEKQ